MPNMIPVTSFAGKTVAVFGLGGSGLASCHALKAGGTEVIAADDNADNVAKAGDVCAVLGLDVGQNCIERLQIGVYVGDNRVLHSSTSN